MIQSLSSLLNGSAVAVAPILLGAFIIRDLDGQRLVGRIVETEAYHQNDAASHSYKGQTPRTSVMFGPPGHAYVYFTYGMHYCFNVVSGPAGEGSAVLIRAIEPLEGIEYMSNRRGHKPLNELANGPAKLCYALGIDKTMNGHDLHLPPLQLLPGPEIGRANIVQTTRIGISRAIDKPWRFYIRDNQFISHR